MRFHIIYMLMKVIINLKIDHENLFVAFNVILVLWNIFLKYYMFLWNTMFFFCLASMKTYVSCLPRSILLVLLGKIFFSMRWNSGYSFEDDTFHQGKLLTDNVITVNFSSTRQFSSTVFDILLPSKNCWTFSDYFHLGIVNFEGLSEGFYACYQTVLHLLLFLVFSSHFNIHLTVSSILTLLIKTKLR